jgi:hypothetical protein
LAALSSRERGTWSLIEVAYVDGLGRVQGGGTDSLALGSVIRFAREGSFASVQLFFLASEGSLTALVGDLSFRRVRALARDMSSASFAVNLSRVMVRERDHGMA